MFLFRDDEESHCKHEILRYACLPVGRLRMKIRPCTSRAFLLHFLRFPPNTIPN